VDGGNLLTGTAFADMTRGQVMCAGISMMGYDALAVGEVKKPYWSIAKSLRFPGYRPMSMRENNLSFTIIR
jgi:2',3'-cyclic-nucleotide 2'-phosphodiesterase (5'-nucleotidase family)